MTHTTYQTTSVLEGSLLLSDRSGKFYLPPSIHPISNLLQLSPAEVLSIYRENQRLEFLDIFTALEAGKREIVDEIPLLKRAVEAYPDNLLTASTTLDHIRELFLDLHDHVMGHPVWLHPFFCRFFTGDFTHHQLLRFSQHYFNQVKNTRQCVAMAIGRFHSLARLQFGPLNDVASELAQLILAGLLADEYGTSAEAPGPVPHLSIRDLFSSTTHIALYRQLFEALDLREERQHIPLLHGIADNVLTQRLLAGNAAFDELEALASVGLGMEWGVPAFFSLLLGGVLRHAYQGGLILTPRHVEIFTAHVRQDVEHAIAVMLVTAMLAPNRQDVAKIKNATNVLMSSRYQMMSDIYEDSYGASCPSIQRIDLPMHYHIADTRIVEALRSARRAVHPYSVINYDTYVASEQVPFRFAL